MKPCGEAQFAATDDEKLAALVLAVEAEINEVTFLELQERGIRFHDLVCDEARGLQAGVRDARLSIPLSPDLFHLLRDAPRLTQRLERAAYQAIATAERARWADQEAKGRIRRGRPLKVRVPLPEAEAAEARAVAVYDAWLWLLGKIRQALEPISSEGRLVSVAQARATLETAVELLRELSHPEMTAFANSLEARISPLLAPLEWLKQQLRPLSYRNAPCAMGYSLRTSTGTAGGGHLAAARCLLLAG
ncbi:MAG: hypothetical protein N2556_08820 [Anaerolineae bacterium]|nr:hypothetical protein [Anaerolineae bacterium]